MSRSALALRACSAKRIRVMCMSYIERPHDAYINKFHRAIRISLQSTKRLMGRQVSQGQHGMSKATERTTGATHCKLYVYKLYARYIGLLFTWVEITRWNFISANESLYYIMARRALLIGSMPSEKKDGKSKWGKKKEIKIQYQHVWRHSSLVFLFGGIFIDLVDIL